jgi:hypothetical protein
MLSAALSFALRDLQLLCHDLDGNLASAGDTIGIKIAFKIALCPQARRNGAQKN